MKNKQNRNLKYEQNFMKYLFRGDYERMKEICKNINVVESISKTREAQE